MGLGCSSPPRVSLPQHPILEVGDLLDESVQPLLRRGGERDGEQQGGHGSLLRCWSKKAKTRCQSRACSAGSAMMCVMLASGRNSNFLPARKSVSASRSDSLKCTLSSAVPWMIRSGRDRSLAYVTALLRA